MDKKEIFFREMKIAVTLGKLSNVCELFLVESWRWRIVISQACYVEVYNIQVLIGYLAQNVLITIEQFLIWKTNMNINQLFLSALDCKKNNIG